MTHIVKPGECRWNGAGQVVVAETQKFKLSHILHGLYYHIPFVNKSEWDSAREAVVVEVQTPQVRKLPKLDGYGTG